MGKASRRKKENNKKNSSSDNIGMLNNNDVNDYVDAINSSLTEGLSFYQDSDGIFQDRLYKIIDDEDNLDDIFEENAGETVEENYDELFDHFSDIEIENDDKVLSTNKTGKITDATEKLLTLRIGYSVEPSELLGLLLTDVNDPMGTKYCLIVALEGKHFPSFDLRNIETMHTHFKKYDNTSNYRIEDAFVVDELCRCITQSIPAVIMLRSYYMDEDTYDEISVVRSWNIRKNGLVEGVSEAELFDAYHKDATTGEIISGELSDTYCGTKDFTVS